MFDVSRSTFLPDLRPVAGWPCLVLVLLGLVLFIAPARAQDTIRPADSAQLLRRIWMTRGSVIPGNEQIGSGVASLGDISGDGIGDFAVRWSGDGRWRVYYGADSAPSTVPAWISGIGSSALLVSGDFWGTGHKALCFGYEYENDIHSAWYYGLQLYRTEHDSIEDLPALNYASGDQWCTKGIIAADIDQDGTSELLVTKGCSFAEILIYKGGANFQVDTPTKILLDTERLTTDQPYHMIVGDFDGDHKPDILTAGYYAVGEQLKFWLSSLSGSVWNWDQPNKVVTLTGNDFPRLSFDLTAVDCDGDGTLDLILPGPDGRTYIYLSRAAGKNATSRSFALADADKVFVGMAADMEPIGYLNDSQQRYCMFGLLGGDPKGNGFILATFGGGPYGPDAAYEAYYGARYDDLYDGLLYSFVTPLSDVNGDGWNDVLIGDWEYYSENIHPGIALILAGGPYIPRDVSLGVREIAAEDRRNAVTIWPTPVTDELNIAWRGDLSRMPERFTVFDALGRRVADGAADAWRGTVVWHCSGQPPGLYLLAILDRNGVPIATARVVKR